MKTIREGKYIWRFLYYNFAIYLPRKTHFGGPASLRIRRFICRHIFEYCGDNVNIEHGARFGAGTRIRIGNNSGLGVNCVVPNGSIIGENVMMGPNCYIHERNHSFSRVDIPMIKQGYAPPKPIIIDDDVWIGRDVTIMVGRHIAKGSIIAANCVLTKDYPEFSIVGGNPSRLIRSRKQIMNSEDNSICNHSNL